MRKFKASITALVVFILMFLMTGISSGQQGATVNLFTSGSILHSTTTPGWLHVSGENIYGSNGSVVKLRFTQLYSGNQIPSQKVYETDIAQIENWGFNGIRLRIYWGLVEPTPNSINTAWFTTGSSNRQYQVSVDQIIWWAHKHGLYVLFEPNWSPWYPVPSWAAVRYNAITNWDSYVYWNNGSIPYGAMTDLFHNTTIANGAAYFYQWMANHYANYSNVMFESFNEWLTLAGFASDGGIPYQQFNDKWISAVENGEGSNYHIKAVEYLAVASGSPGYNIGATYHPYIAGSHSNVVMATHDYNSIPNGTTNWQSIQYRANDAHSINLPIINTEGDDSRTGTTAFANLLAAYDQYNYVGWTWYHDSPDPNTESSRNLNYPSTASRVLPIMQPYF